MEAVVIHALVTRGLKPSGQHETQEMGTLPSGVSALLQGEHDAKIPHEMKAQKRGEQY
jgi:hypothetical protein